MLNRRIGLLPSICLTVFFTLFVVACGSGSGTVAEDEASQSSAPSGECLSAAEIGLNKLGYYWDKVVLNQGRNILLSSTVTEWKAKYLDVVGDLDRAGCPPEVLVTTTKFDEYLDQDDTKSAIERDYLDDEALEAGWKAIETDQLTLGFIDESSHAQGPPTLTNIEAIDDPYILAIAKAAPSLRLLPETFLEGAEATCGSFAGTGMTPDEIAESRMSLFESAAKAKLSSSERMAVLKIIVEEFCPEDLPKLE